MHMYSLAAQEESKVKVLIGLGPSGGFRAESTFSFWGPPTVLDPGPPPHITLTSSSIIMSPLL